MMSVSPLPLSELLSISEPRGVLNRAIRRAQMGALLRQVPVILGGQLLAAALLVIALSDSVPLRPLLFWWSALAGLCGWRAYRAWRFRHDAAYLDKHRPDLRTIAKVALALGLMWWIPALYFFQSADASDRLVLLLINVGLVSAAAFTMATVPFAALLQVWSLSAAGVFMALQFSEGWVSLLTLIYATVMSFAVVAHARQFVTLVRARLQLQEQGELLTLFQELRTSGSAGLWELDSEQKIRRVSAGLGEGVSPPKEGIVGKTVREVLDPSGRISQLSAGLRSRFDHIDNAHEFRDIAVPTNSAKWWSLSGKPSFDENGKLVGWRGVASDITALRLEGADAVRAARVDPLTGVANRLLVREYLEEALLRQINSGQRCALLLVDLDRFKLVNDTLGHAVGDQLLCEVAKRLEQTVSPGGTVGRLGGDEFAVVWAGATDDESLSALAQRIIQQMTRSFQVSAVTVNVGATIGIARGGCDGAREEQLMRSADLALYQAKEGGRGGYAFFNHEMFLAAEDHRSLENDVREALESGALRLVYQAIVDAVSGEVVGREALLRWYHPNRGDIAPSRFIPIIEDAGLIHRIGDWVIRNACAEAAAWRKPLRIAVNVSAAQLTGPGLLKTVVGALAATGLPADRLELEVTENVFLGDDSGTLESLGRLRALGVRLVLDDFGKGYSSFGYLARACFAKIKIDQSFVRAAAEGTRESTAIVEAILALARGLGVETTAEGIETQAQADAMRAFGCNQLQGYLFGRPLSADSEEAQDWRACEAYRRTA